MLHPILTNFAERDAGRIPAVWEGLFSYVFVTYIQPPKLTSVYRLFASGKLRPVIYDKKSTLDSVADGLMALEMRKTWGKAVIRVREDETARARL